MPISRVCLSGARVIDPAQGLDDVRDVVVRAGRVEGVYRPGRAPGRFGRTWCLEGLWLLPGLIDLHVHLRQPGGSRAETVASGTAAAAAGGFTTIVCMPNTHPVLDRPALLNWLDVRLRRQARVRVLTAAALSVGLEGECASEFEALVRAGAVALSDDGLGTRRSAVLAAALRFSARTGVVVMSHSEDHRLSRGGVMHAGEAAVRLGLPGIPAAAEVRRVARDLDLLQRFGGRLHLQHLSCQGSLELVSRAKARGLPVSCEATPHHLLLSTEDLERTAIGGRGPHPDWKVKPPLRAPADRAALRRALADGTIDALATDHAPHPAAAKARGFAAAPFGLVGLETALGLALRLVDEGVCNRTRAVALLTRGPAGVLDLPLGSLCPGRLADAVVVDPRARWRVVPGRLRSRSGNTPFAGWTLRGRVLATLVGGRVVFRARFR